LVGSRPPDEQGAGSLKALGRFHLAAANNMGTIFNPSEGRSNQGPERPMDHRLFCLRGAGFSRIFFATKPSTPKDPIDLVVLLQPEHDGRRCSWPDVVGQSPFQPWAMEHLCPCGQRALSPPGPGGPRPVRRPFSAFPMNGRARYAATAFLHPRRADFSRTPVGRNIFPPSPETSRPTIFMPGPMRRTFKSRFSGFVVFFARGLLGGPRSQRPSMPFTSAMREPPLFRRGSFGATSLRFGLFRIGRRALLA